MTKKLSVWGREFDLEIIFDRYTGEDNLEHQEDALHNFLSLSNIIDATKDDVEKYCLHRDSDEIGGSIENIFKYVIPTFIFIKRTKDKKRVVALMCNYRLDIEHGIAVVFENEQFSFVGNQQAL